MPTKHRRISVVVDDELEEALYQASKHVDGKKPATLVHDLAIRGAEAIREEARNSPEARQRRREFLARFHELVDLDVLARVDELAWGYSYEDE